MANRKTRGHPRCLSQVDKKEEEKKKSAETMGILLVSRNRLKVAG